MTTGEKMTGMPARMIFVRHGQSEGNVAHGNLKKGLGHLNPPSIIGTDGWTWRLTETGILQAQSTGIWIKENILNSTVIDAVIVSPYIRAKETAIHLIGEEEIPYFEDFRVRERDWGEYDKVLSQDEFDSHKDEILRSKGDIHWTPPKGESIIDVMSRCQGFCDMIVRHYREQTIMIVNHGEFMQAMMMYFFKWSITKYFQLKEKNPALLDPVNCQITELSRLHPETGELNDRLSWVRCVVAYDSDHKNNIDWFPFPRVKSTTETFIEEVEEFPCHF